MQLSFLEIVWSFGSYFYDLLGRSRARPSLEIIISHYQGKTFLSTVLNTPQIMSFSRLAGGIVFALHECKVQFHQPFQMALFLHPHVVPQLHICFVMKYYAEYFRETLCRSPGHSVWSSLFWDSILLTLADLVPLASPLCFLNSDCLPGSASGTCAKAWQLFQDSMLE